MITHLDSLGLATVAGKGGSLEVDGKQFDSLALAAVAARLQPGAFLKIHNSSKFNSLAMSSICSKAQGTATVIFC